MSPDSQVRSHDVKFSSLCRFDLCKNLLFCGFLWFVSAHCISGARTMRLQSVNLRIFCASFMPLSLSTQLLCSLPLNAIWLTIGPTHAFSTQLFKKSFFHGEGFISVLMPGPGKKSSVLHYRVCWRANIITEAPKKVIMKSDTSQVCGFMPFPAPEIFYAFGVSQFDTLKA